MQKKVAMARIALSITNFQPEAMPEEKFNKSKVDNLSKVVSAIRIKVLYNVFFQIKDQSNERRVQLEKAELFEQFKEQMA